MTKYIGEEMKPYFDGFEWHPIERTIHCPTESVEEQMECCLYVPKFPHYVYFPFECINMVDDLCTIKISPLMSIEDYLINLNRQ